MQVDDFYQPDFPVRKYLEVYHPKVVAGSQNRQLRVGAINSVAVFYPHPSPPPSLKERGGDFRVEIVPSTTQKYPEVYPPIGAASSRNQRSRGRGSS